MERSSGIVLSSGDMSQKGSSRPIVRRRRNVKGLIAGESRGSAPTGSGDTKNAGAEETNASKPSAAHHQPRPSNNSSASASAEAPSVKSLANPCCSARLALACVQNALQMGVATKFFLCPQGRARKSLLGQARLNKAHHSKAEEKFLINPASASQHDVEDGFSSGDDDDFDKTIEQDGQNPNNKNKALHIINARNREPFFVPTGPDASSMACRGERYFDAVTAADRAVARHFLRQEIHTANRSYSKALVNHLKNNEQLLLNNNTHTQIDNKSDPIHEQKVALANTQCGISIESLSINHHESIEGMAKCYDGIVSAGMALLDIDDTTIDGKIMTALTPLLVTTLEQPSGEVFIALAKLRNYCGTRRYQRRFVQRIAPFLVRPPEGRNILKDTHRAESLRTAASQLRRLNSPSPTGGLLVGLSTPGLHRRGSQASTGFGSIGAKRDGVSSDSLEEWEVLAIDVHIRHSVMDLFSKDWSRISTLSNTMKEHDTPYGRRRGISASKSKEWQDTTTTASSQLSNFGLTKSPRTINNSKLPLSPRNATLLGGLPNTPTAQLPSADALESTFGPSFSSQHVVIEDTDPPPPPTNFSPPSAPSSPTRESLSKPGTPNTPPSHFHEFRSTDRLSMPNLQEQRSSSQSIATEPSSPGSRSREMGSVPLSPQSQSSAGVGAQRPASLSPSIMKDQYRALTSTAAERKRTVAACRALRAQITQFEDAFIKMHGRAPKGFSERAPLASTYTQYREWKRAIRADAACRIQALFRGAKARLTLRHSHDEKIARFVSKRFKVPATSHGAQGRPIEQSLNHLSIPLDIGRSDADSPLPRTRLETRTGQRGDDSVEVVMNPGASSATGSTSPTPSSSPNWRNRSQRRQQPSGGGTSRSSSGRRSSSSGLPDVTVMSLAELQQRKRELKQQLKQYDMNFHAQHGRMPEKREKEPIRHLYESYNTKRRSAPGPGTAAFRGADVSPSNSPSASPTFNSGSLTPPPGGDSHFKKATDLSEESSKSEDEVESGTGGSSQDLASLKAEKATLHQMLRSYEKDFFKEHKRQVSSFADIRPVAGQYRRYKEIKKAIASLS
ncbi:putative Rho-GAP-like protein [Skeletonema marinoi]|uniref:Rho-GAP-like protein n=1 Tax=Skeletonema marinoi TaxID=267567 RepID=A0AAD9DH44_9STRA|nr:putative Rho-GAP-like protein [Skeletonema marinoi]